MSSDEFKMPDVLDVTEVEKTRLHEEAETKRCAIKETEQTKRVRAAKWENTGFLSCLGFGGVAATLAISVFMAISINNYLNRPGVPRAIEPCIESQSVLKAKVSMQCPPGAHLSVEPISATDEVVAKCTCGSIK